MPISAAVQSNMRWRAYGLTVAARIPADDGWKGGGGWRSRITLRRCSAHFHQPRVVALPFPIFFGGALVVLLFAAGETHVDFGATSFPELRLGNERVAL